MKKPMRQENDTNALSGESASDIDNHREGKKTIRYCKRERKSIIRWIRNLDA